MADNCLNTGTVLGLNVTDFHTIDNTAKAVIYPARTVSGYGHIYSLGTAGIYITALAHIGCSNFISRFVHEKWVVPDPRLDHDNFIDWLVENGKRQTVMPVLFMADDPYVYLACLYHDRLQEYYRFPYISPDTLDVFFHKGAMYRKASEAGIPVPRTIYPAEAQDSIDQWSSFPSVIKPVVSRFRFKGKTFIAIGTFPELYGSKALFAADRSQAREYLKGAEAAGIECCVQEYIPGDNPNLFTIYFVLSKAGASLPFRRITRFVSALPISAPPRSAGQNRFRYCGNMQNNSVKQADIPDRLLWSSS